MFLAILISLYGTLPTTTIERAARVADTYQPQAPTVRLVYRERCVTTTDSNGNPTAHRCGL